MKRIIYVTILLLYSLFSMGQKEIVFIDTDAATDDLRAISLLLSLKEFDIQIITASDGALSPDQGITKVNSLLKYSGHSNVALAKGRISSSAPPPWRQFVNTIEWGGKNLDTSVVAKADAALADLIKKSNQDITLICLGSMRTLADLIKNFPESKMKIKKVIWYNEYKKPMSGTNYETDKSAADFVLSTNLNVVCISNLKKPNAKIDDVFLIALKNIPTPFSQIIYNSVKSINDHPNDLIIWDDLIPVYLLKPNIFDIQEDVTSPNHSFVVDYPIEKVKLKMLEILEQSYSTELNIAFERFPVSPDYYQYDLQDFVTNTVNKYGAEEWKFCVLTNEIHGHLGVYSIVGAKMGLKAREILNAPLDRLDVTTFAGAFPPLSCLNDGLQISTGATLGLGLIHISADSLKKPQAIFKFNNQKIRLTLKSSFTEKVEKDIKAGILKYGNLTQGYWKLVRQQAIKYWSEWDRNEMFEIEILK